MLSFMRESRRLTNTRMKQELHVNLRYPTVAAGIAASAAISPESGKILPAGLTGINCPMNPYWSLPISR